MLELIVIIAVIVYLLSRVEKVRAGKQNANSKAVSAKGASDTAERSTATRPARKLTIEGTEEFPLSKAGFFSGFGIPTARLCDARCFKSTEAFSEFPDAVNSAVTAIYEEGTAVGADVMRLLFQSKKLEVNESVYFALTQVGTKAEDYVMYAFVDRTR